jgi:LPLT family lysophospholipid transporter-like MFS transporter
MRVIKDNLVSGNLFSKAMSAVLVAQFLSALADNALLFAAIALLKTATDYQNWYAPLLQEFFVISFILFAPFVGPFADSFPKGRVMLVSNAFKFIGAFVMLMGFNPWLAYGLVGLGAAAYSPAKYGILSQLVSPDKLVKANSLMEGSTIVAILLGAICGGWLTDISVQGALWSVAICYILAAIANYFIPRLPAEHPLSHFSPALLIKDFFHALRVLYSNKDARFSLIGTCLFWGSGSTLRFLLVAWVPVALLIMDNKTPANLSGIVAIGIAVGAALAARFVSLKTTNRVLPIGILLGVLILGLSQLNNLYTSAALLIAVGACGGFFVVPLNALLQERGHESVGAGHAIAIQNFSENIAMLLLVGLYTLTSHAGASVITSMIGFGILILIGMSALAWFRRYASK